MKRNRPYHLRDIRCMQQLAFLNLWDRLRGSDKLPRISSLQADDLRRIAEQLIFCDVVRSGGDTRFLIRYQGSQIRRLFGADTVGRYLDDDVIPPIKRGALQMYQRVVERRQPDFSAVRLRNAEGVTVQYERLLLPFASEKPLTARIVCVLSLFCEENGFPPEIVRNGRPI